MKLLNRSDAVVQVEVYNSSSIADYAPDPYDILIIHMDFSERSLVGSLRVSHC